jgi:alpha-D-ribose 1-methylphosphonate 5-triphosphate synthase subunit PhnG
MNDTERDASGVRRDVAAVGDVERDASGAQRDAAAVGGAPRRDTTAAGAGGAGRRDVATPGGRMSRLRRTRVLVDGSSGLATELCGRIRQRYAVTTLSEPRELLVVIKVRESAQGSLFYLGEALATECRVRLEGVPGDVPGIGLLLGSERRRAFELAVIDAALSVEEPLPEEPDWTALLEAEEERLAGLARVGRERIGLTRVEFASMLTEEERRG